MIRFALLAAPVLLAGCVTTTTGSDEPVRVGADGACDAADAQAMLGMTATSEVGAQLLESTGAKTLRWAPPRSAMTMDFRPDRLTVTYDDDMTIDRISCG